MYQIDFKKPMHIHFIGIGGITCAQDVLEFILVGAHAVEIGTMNFVRPDAAFRIAEELPHLCQQLGIKNLAEFRGTLQLLFIDWISWEGRGNLSEERLFPPLPYPLPHSKAFAFWGSPFFYQRFSPSNVTI